MFRLIDRCVGFSYSVAYVAYRFCIDIVSLVLYVLRAEYGSRTRLPGLGSPCTTDVLIPQALIAFESPILSITY